MTERTPSPADWKRAERRAKRQPRRCSYCGDPSHTIDRCPDLLKKDDKP